MAPARTSPSPAEDTPKGGGGAFARILFLLLAIAAAAMLYRYWGFWQSEPEAQAAPPPPTVTVAKPLIKEMEEWSDFTGQFEPIESVEVRARVSGYLESITVAPFVGLATGRKMGMLMWRVNDADDMAELARMLADGRVRPHIDHTCSLEDVPGALSRVDSGDFIGKIAVAI